VRVRARHAVEKSITWGYPPTSWSSGGQVGERKTTTQKKSTYSEGVIATWSKRCKKDGGREKLCEWRKGESGANVLLEKKVNDVDDDDADDGGRSDGEGEREAVILLFGCIM